jgi:DUF1680 family protein
MSSIDRRRFLQAAAAMGLITLPIAGRTIGYAGTNKRLLNSNGVSVIPTLQAVENYNVQAVPLNQVTITDSFWRPRMEANRNVSLDYCLVRFESGSVFNVAKLVEAAAYMLTDRPDQQLETSIDGTINEMLAFLDSRLESPDQAVRVSGHFLEAATAYYKATGKRQILEVALKAADRIDQGYGPEKDTYISGHQGLKMGLIALYRNTGDDRYWKLAKFFADERGKEDYERLGEYARDRTMAQDHAPVIEQTEAVGHCVRATFLYIPMTDIGTLAQSDAYNDAVDAIWQDTIHYKTYLTGGIGSIRFHEQFGEAYELPNLSAWNETCAAYGMVVWNHRLFLRDKHAKYIDVMERVLYNALLVGVNLQGDRFFYQNPLKSFGDYERFEWINVPCCPPNVVRMVASVGEYIYASDSANEVYVNLFIDSTAQVTLNETTVTLRQDTRYPWDGQISLHVDPESATRFTVHLRIPGWTGETVMPGDLYQFIGDTPTPPTVRLNGEPVPLVVEYGYIRLDRTWNAGDLIELDLPMPVRQVVAHPNVEDDRDRVALQRGPLVYCAEWPDNGGRALNIVVPDDAELDTEFRPDLLEGIQVISGPVQAVERRDNNNSTTRTVTHQLTAIPYYVWANRGMGEMAVWMARTPTQAWLPPLPPKHISEVRTSGGVQKGWTGYNDQNDDLASVYDGREPLNSADQSHRFFRMRPPVGQPAWLEYVFKQPTEISLVETYWFDDKRFCKFPSSWRILYLYEDRWHPVTTQDAYTVAHDTFSTVTFDPVTTTAVRLEVEPQTESYKVGDIGPPGALFLDEDIEWREFGLIEWRVT